MCMRSFMEKNLGYLDVKILKDILAEFTPASIKFNWRGEPLLHPEIVNLVRIAKDEGVTEVQFNTNGYFLTKDIACNLAKAGLDRIIISVDGVSKETYENIRMGGDFYKLFNNILEIYKAYADLENAPKIRLQICKQPANEHEIKRWKETFRRLADELRVGNLFNPQGKSSYSKKQPKSCNQLWQRMTINWNGDIFPCPSDFLETEKMGNIRCISIHEAWHSPKMEYLRKSIQEYGRNHTNLCKNCSSYC